MREQVAGHQNYSGSSFAEQNHSSIARVAPDDPKRTLEQNIEDIMERDRLLFQGKQLAKVKWAGGYGDAIKKMSTAQKRHLSEARKVLDKRSFQDFEEQYNLYPQYNVTDEVRGGVSGAVVSHTSSSPEKGYFIPDDGVCPCSHEKAKCNHCRHLIAKKVHRKELPFMKEKVDRRHIFIEKLPSVMAIHAQTSTRPPTSQRVSSGAAGEGHPPSTSNALVFSSPSKVAAAASAESHLPPSQDVRSNVGFLSLSNTAKDVVEAARGRCNTTQHLVLTHLEHLKDLLSSGDYSGEHSESTVFPIAMQLALVAGPGTKVQPGHPKLKGGPRQGAPPVYRFGHEKSTASKPERVCTFCGTQGDGKTVKYHKNKASCPLKADLGLCFEVKDTTRSDVGKEIIAICNGERAGFPDVSSHLDVSSKLVLNSVPTKTRRLQIKGYHQKEGATYLFCSCVDASAKIIMRQEGSRTVSYNDVLVDVMSVLTSLGKIDYVFHAPIVAVGAGTAEDVAALM